jgi:ribosomal protein L11 methylase PrmA
MYRYKVTISSEKVPLTEELLFAAGALSVSVEADISSGPERSLLTALFQEMPDLTGALTPSGPEEPDIEPVTESSWKDLHLTGFTGLEPVPGIFIRPVNAPGHISAEPGPEPSGIGIVTMYLDPRGAFGDGGHETTALCLEALDIIFKKKFTTAEHPPRALDVGTGTGILAIFMALKGAASVTAVDICPESIVRAEENAAYNQVKNIDFVNCPVGDLDGREAFDLMAANLQSAVIEDNIAALAGFLKPGGTAVISGVMNIHEETITKVISSRLEIVSVHRKGDWLAFIAEKNQQ